MNAIRRLIRANGSTMELAAGSSMEQLRGMIRAEALDTVSLRNLGHPLHVMLLDDGGHAKLLPVNAEATKLYWANCLSVTTDPIVGDVIILPDADFAPKVSI